MVSMKDIANQLDLSRCTVSNILNGRLEGKSYRKETIESVLATAKSLGYVSNSMARALKTGQTGTIAIVVPDIANTFYIKIIKEVERRANECGYSLIICMAEEILEKENAALTMLQSRCVDGVLISPVSYTKSLRTPYPFKIVCFDRPVNRDAYSYVLIDNYKAGLDLAETLIANGARKPLFLCGSKHDYTVIQRYNGLCDALRLHGLLVDKRNYLSGLYDEQSAYAALKQAIAQGLEFDSVFLSTNYFIYGVLHALRECERNIVSICGFESFIGMDFYRRELNLHVLHQPEEELGKVAFEKMQRLIQGEENSGIILPTYVL